MDNIISGSFEQLDHVIVEADWMSNRRSIWGDRYRILQSHHVITVVDMGINSPIIERLHRKPNMDLAALLDEGVKQKYRSGFVAEWSNRPQCESTHSTAGTIALCMLHSAKEHRPALAATPCRPWITQRTLQFI
eukprot:188316-Pyramimonas_sp.AAC.1